MKGGYYKQLLNNKITVLCLNTNLYYTKNPLIKKFVNCSDPAGQFQFMEKTFLEAQSKGRFVHIIAHLPPGGKLSSPLILVGLLQNFCSTLLAHLSNGHLGSTEKAEKNSEFLCSPSSFLLFFSFTTHCGTNVDVSRLQLKILQSYSPL